MTNNYYQKHKHRLQKEVRERYQNLFEVEKKKDKERPQKYIKIFLKKKKRQYHRERMKNNYLIHKKNIRLIRLFFGNHRTTKFFISWISPCNI